MRHQLITHSHLIFSLLSLSVHRKHCTVHSPDCSLPRNEAGSQGKVQHDVFHSRQEVHHLPSIHKCQENGSRGKEDTKGLRWVHGHVLVAQHLPSTLLYQSPSRFWVPVLVSACDDPTSSEIVDCISKGLGLEAELEVRGVLMRAFLCAARECCVCFAGSRQSSNA